MLKFVTICLMHTLSIQLKNQFFTISYGILQYLAYFMNSAGTIFISSKTYLYSLASFFLIIDYDIKLLENMQISFE